MVKVVKFRRFQGAMEDGDFIETPFKAGGSIRVIAKDQGGGCGKGKVHGDVDFRSAIEEDREAIGMADQSEPVPGTMGKWGGADDGWNLRSMKDQVARVEVGPADGEGFKGGAGGRMRTEAEEMSGDRSCLRIEAVPEPENSGEWGFQEWVFGDQVAAGEMDGVVDVRARERIGGKRPGIGRRVGGSGKVGAGKAKGDGAVETGVAGMG